MTKIFTKNNFIVLGLCFLFVAAATFGAFRFSTWHDESYSAVLIERSIGGIIKTTANDVHPPLYYIVLKAWSALFGDTMPILRLSSVLFMLLAVLIIWRTLISEKVIKKWPIFVLAIMLFGPFTLRYGFEARMYAFGALLVAIAFWLQMKIIKQKAFNWRYGLGLGLVFAAALLTHNFLSFFVVATAVFTAMNVGVKNLFKASFFKTQKSAQVKTMVMSYAIAGVLFLPWLPSMIGQFSKVTFGGFWIGPLKVETPTSMLLNSMTYLPQWMVSGWVAVILFVVLVAILALLYRGYKISVNSSAGLYSILMVVVPLILLVIISLPPLRSAFQDRYLSFYGSFLYALIGIGMVSLLEKRSKLNIFAVTIVIFGVLAGVAQVLVTGNNQGYTPNPHYMSNEIIQAAKQANADNPVVLVSNDLGYFFDLRVVSRHTGINNYFYTPTGTNLYRYGNYSAMNDREELLLRDFNSLPKGTRVWFVYNVGQDKPNDDPLKNAKLVEQKSFGYAKVNVYEIQ